MPRSPTFADTAGAAEAATRPTPAARRKKAARKRSVRLLLLTAAGIIAGIAALATLGYTLLLQHVDPAAAQTAIARHLNEHTLQPHEVIEAQTPVQRRSWSTYFRTTHGQLVATNQRVILLTVSPAVRGAGGAGRIVVDRLAWNKDTTVTVEAGFAFSMRRGVVVETPNSTHRFAVRDEDEAAAQAVIRNVQMRHEHQRAFAAGWAAAQEEAMRIAREPIYYTIRRGDAVSTIARAYNITPAELLALNDMTSDRIRAGDSLLVKPEGLVSTTAVGAAEPGDTAPVRQQQRAP